METKRVFDRFDEPTQTAISAARRSAAMRAALEFAAMFALGLFGVFAYWLAFAL